MGNAAHTIGVDGRTLSDHGWTVRDAWKTCGAPEAYRDYIRRSRAEFSAAKPSCRILANAWVSDRTLCYLASGPPAVVEYTGPSRELAQEHFDGVQVVRSLLERALA